MKTTVEVKHIKDIWVYYSWYLLNNNPEWWGATYCGIPNYNLYRKYTDEDGRLHVITAFTFEQFSKIIYEYFEGAKQKIIEGQVLDMTSGVGKIFAKRAERNFNRKSVDFYKTKQQELIYDEKTGKMKRSKVIYWTTNDWCMISWLSNGRLKNISVYKFRITKNLKSGLGFNQQLVKALQENPNLKYKYILHKR